MKIKSELKKNILKTINPILEKFPLLVKYAGEIPAAVPDTGDAETTIKNLKDNNKALGILLKKYTGK